MRLLVCGNRDWPCRNTIAAWLGRFKGPDVTVIHGAQRTRAYPNLESDEDYGADFLAGEVANAMGFAVEEYPADWKRHGPAAGPIRNEEMAQKDIHRGLAFGRLVKLKGTRIVGRTGTGDMVDRLNARGVLVTVVPRPGVMP